MEASHSGRHRGGKSGYEMSQKDDAADASKSKASEKIMKTLICDNAFLNIMIVTVCRWNVCKLF